MIKIYGKAFVLLLTTVCRCQAVLAQDTVRVATAAPAPYPDTTARTSYFNAAGVIIPGTFLLYGALKPAIHGIANLDDKIMAQVRKSHPGFHTNAADYIMWTPSAAIYLMDAFSIKTKHSFKEHFILDAGSLLITGGAGIVMRKITATIKDYNTQGTKFPSGHTANAFRGAELFHQELKDSHELLSYSGYVVAAGVGAIRIFNKDHLLTEVLAGAGLGILSTKISYWIFDRVKYRHPQHQ